MTGKDDANDPASSSDEAPDFLDEDDEKSDEAPKSFPRALLSLLLSILGWILWIMWGVLTLSLVLYVAVAVCAMYSTEVKLEFLFMNRLPSPLFANLSNPQGYGLYRTENFYLDGNAGKLGAWFSSPTSKQYITKEAYILYLHGSSGSRAKGHRVELVRKFTKMGYHVLMIDYRGYGDSDGWPTEEGTVEDSKVAFKWLMKKAHGHPVYIVGHSMGAAVGLQLAAWLNLERTQLNGLVLMSPFNCAHDVVYTNMFFRPAVTFVPYFANTLDDIRNVFRSDHWIQKIHTPTLIMHDRDDQFIPVELGWKLYKAAKEVGTTNVRMEEFNEHLGHDYVFRSSRFKSVVREFVLHTS